MPPDRLLWHVAIWLTCLQSIVNAARVYGDAGVSAILDGQYISETSMEIRSTKLTTVDKLLTKMMPNVQTLTFYSNYMLRNFSDDALEDLAKLKSLTMTYTGLKKIPNLAPVKMTLERLNILSSLITTIPTDTFNGMEKLIYLLVSQSPLTHFPNLRGVRSLRTMHFMNTKMSSIDASNLPPEATVFTISYNEESMNAAPLARSMPKLNELRLTSDPSTVHLDDYLKGCHDLRILKARGNSLTSFPDLDSCSGTITTIDLYQNNITVILRENLINLTALTRLTLDKNPLTFLPVMLDTAFAPNLGYLNVNYLIPRSSGALSIQFPKVDRVYLTNSSLTVFPNISDNFRIVALSKNLIHSISASSFSETLRVTTIDLTDNGLEIFPPIAILPYLTQLTLNSNPIRNITWAAANPTNLNLNSLPLSRLYLAGVVMTEERDPSLWQKLVSLRYLYMTKCHLTEFPPYLREVARLSLLDLDDNNIKELNPDDLSKMTLLTYLYIRRNKLTYVSAASMKALNNLRYIYLEGNNLKTLRDIWNPTRFNPRVDLKDNKFVCDWRLCWMVNITGMTVYMDETPCTGPTRLMNTPWKDVTRELLYCDEYEDAITVSDLTAPLDLFVRRPGGLFTISSVSGYQDTMVTNAVQKPITLCSLQCVKGGETCIGFVIETTIGDCWLMVEVG